MRMQEPFFTSFEALTSLEIIHPDVALFLADVSKSRHIRPFFAKECTLSQAAKELDLPLGTMRYWVSKMEELGLLKLSRTEKRKGSPIKYYRTVADTFVVPLEVFPLTSIEELLRLKEELWLQRIRTALANAALNHEGGWQAHFHLEGSVVFYTMKPKQGELEDAGIFYLLTPLRLTPQQAKTMRSELRDLQTRYMMLSENNTSEEGVSTDSAEDTALYLSYLLSVRDS